MPVPYLFGWSWVWPGRALWTCQTLARRALRKVTRFTSADPHVEMASPTGGGPLCVCVGKKKALRFFLSCARHLRILHVCGTCHIQFSLLMEIYTLIPHHFRCAPVAV